jgi:Cdc6-like AAA superfamily ATPase
MSQQLDFKNLLNLDNEFRPQTEADWEFLAAASQNLFRPKAPIEDDRLFQGRLKQIRDVLDVVYEDGAHAVIFGERGVGKTSLSNILEQRVVPLFSSVKCMKVQCSPEDDFYSLWCEALKEYNYDNTPMGDYIEKNRSLHSIFEIIGSLDQSKYHLVIFDEFDQLKDKNTTILMANLIKKFSNNVKNMTILIVGVGDTLNDLFAGHESIDRCCTQIRMQRMSSDELSLIIDDRIPRLKMKMKEHTKKKIIKLSQGLPGYVHLLGQLSLRSALDRKSLIIEEDDLKTALNEALDKSDYRTRQDYYKAVESPAKDNKYREALLACALAKTNELGMFFAGSVREPYSLIRGREMQIANYATHLSEFCGTDRGPALERSGKRKRYQYRFKNPLLQPLVIMTGVRDGIIGIDQT